MVLPISQVSTRYQVTLSVVDQPGVLAKIATEFSDNNVSVEAVSQSVRNGSEGHVPTATLVIVSHQASESSLAATVEALAANEFVNKVESVLRVEGL